MRMVCTLNKFSYIQLFAIIYMFSTTDRSYIVYVKHPYKFVQYECFMKLHKKHGKDN